MAIEGFHLNVFCYGKTGLGRSSKYEEHELDLESVKQGKVFFLSFAEICLVVWNVESTMLLIYYRCTNSSTSTLWTNHP